jgi:hypothetical protein
MRIIRHEGRRLINGLNTQSGGQWVPLIYKFNAFPYIQGMDISLLYGSTIGITTS